MRGGWARGGACEGAPAGVGVCARANDIVPAHDSAARLTITVSDLTDMAFCSALRLRRLHGPASRGAGQLRRRSSSYARKGPIALEWGMADTASDPLAWQ